MQTTESKREFPFTRPVANQYDFTWYSKVLYKDKSMSYFIIDSEGVFKEYPVEEYDWYITRAIEKLDKLKRDRDKLNFSLAIRFRNAIRENFNHTLNYSYVHLNNVKAIESFIKSVFR